MTNETQINFLKKEIEDEKITLSKRTKINKWKALYVQMSITILSSISTIILGLKLNNYTETTRVIALIISTFITIISGFDAFFNHKRLWLTYADTLHAMESVKLDLDYRLQGATDVTDEELENFKKRYREVLDAGYENWMKLRKENASSKG